MLKYIVMKIQINVVENSGQRYNCSQNGVVFCGFLEKDKVSSFPMALTLLESDNPLRSYEAFKCWVLCARVPPDDTQNRPPVVWRCRNNVRWPPGLMSYKARRCPCPVPKSTTVRRSSVLYCICHLGAWVINPGVVLWHLVPRSLLPLRFGSVFCCRFLDECRL